MESYDILYKVISSNRRSYIISRFGRTKFSLKYEKGAIIESPKGTLGIFLFHNYTLATNFTCPSSTPFLILKVKALGEVTTPEYIVNVNFISTGKDFRRALTNFLPTPNLHTSLTPEGTVLCRRIKILD